MKTKKPNHFLRKFVVSKVYTPKFIPGDLILNKYNGNVYIAKVVDLYRNEDDLNCETAIYKLVTVYHTNSNIKYLYERTKNVRGIDAYYEKIDSKVAQVLYNINVKE